MLKNIIGIYFGFGFATDLFIILYCWLVGQLSLGLIIGAFVLFSFLTLGAAFYFALSLVIDHIEDLLSSIKIESAPDMSLSEPLFEVERTFDDEI